MWAEDVAAMVGYHGGASEAVILEAQLTPWELLAGLPGINVGIGNRGNLNVGNGNYGVANFGGGNRGNTNFGGGNRGDSNFGGGLYRLGLAECEPSLGLPQFKRVHFGHLQFGLPLQFGFRKCGFRKLRRLQQGHFPVRLRTPLAMPGPNRRSLSERRRQAANASH
ncbi:pentapeptide repeat-containing protein [Mycobacterium gastri]|uniref:Uncharacterized protein n=1 Tax=Mycobacterium gastri TaxID=1777 RepID=A0A1X1VAR1_MYCGS|nr:hypothetical protein MGAST_21965 [Mycobacterium gastri 'Wayne']ORV66048.1 hypothetical protein AWC07_11735 [Mycobacterium gastri]